MIDQAADSITTCSQQYRDMTNEQIQKLIEALVDPNTFVDFDLYATIFQTIYGAGPDATELLTAMMTRGPDGAAAWHLDALSDLMGDMKVVEPDYLRDTFVMIGWGVVGMVAAIVAFLRREF